jgi:hypothetical protein
MSVSDVSVRFRPAFLDAAQTAIADAKVLCCLGHPGKTYPPDVFSVGDLTARIDPATMGNRGFEVILTLGGVVSVFRKGPRSMELAVQDRAYDLLNRVEEYFRGDGTPEGNARTTLGGLVRQCFCTGHGPSGGSSNLDLLAKGRVYELPFTFEARARARNS